MLKTMSLEDWRHEFRAWVEKQPDDKEYDYMDDDVCPVRQFMTEVLGLPEDTPFTGAVPVVHATHCVSVSQGPTEEYAATVLSQLPYTFGDLKKRMAASYFYN